MVRNCDAVKYWLLYMKNVLQLSALTGNNTEAVLSKAEFYELSGGKYSYGAEMPLKGEAGIDLSVQYCPADFFEGKRFLSAEAKTYEQWFSAYAKLLGRDDPHILPYTALYLEADTLSGDDRNAGVFYNLSGDFVKPVLPALLYMQGLQRQEDNLLRILNTAEGVLVPWQFGFMYSRKDFSIRLVCYLAKDGWTKLPLLMEKLGYEDFPREDFKCLKEFSENVLVDFDVMEDGRLGDVFGLELSSLPKKIHEQQKWIESERIGRLIARLKEWDIADGRVDMLRDAIFRVRVHPKDMPAFSVKSCFSHFKLRWQKGEKLPAKVYMAISGVLRRQ